MSDIVPPTSLVVEYKKNSLMFKGIFLAVVALPFIVFFAFIGSWPYFFVSAIFVVMFVLGLQMIRRSFLEVALVIGESGINVNNRYSVPWDDISKFDIDVTVTDDFTKRSIVIESRLKYFELDIIDLDIDPEAKHLRSWISFYRQRKWQFAKRTDDRRR